MVLLLGEVWAGVYVVVTVAARGGVRGVGAGAGAGDGERGLGAGDVGQTVPGCMFPCLEEVLIVEN